jgi:hypothetical protein
VQARAAFKKQIVDCSVKSYRELEWKFQVQHNTVTKYLTKIAVQRKAENPYLKFTALQQTVIKATLENLIYKCVIVDEFFFTVEGNAWPQQSYHESEDHPAAKEVKFIHKIPAKILWWLIISEYGVSKPLFYKSCLAVK